MNAKVLVAGLALVSVCKPAKAQSPRAVRAVAVIESIYADSAGRAIQSGRPIPPASLDSLLTRLKPTVGATIWFSWSGGPEQPRTEAQDCLLEHLRASGIRVELRSDSTFFSRVIRP